VQANAGSMSSVLLINRRLGDAVYRGHAQPPISSQCRFCNMLHQAQQHALCAYAGSMPAPPSEQLVGCCTNATGAVAGLNSRLTCQVSAHISLQMAPPPARGDCACRGPGNGSCCSERHTSTTPRQHCSATVLPVHRASCSHGGCLGFCNVCRGGGCGRHRIGGTGVGPLGVVADEGSAEGVHEGREDARDSRIAGTLERGARRHAKGERHINVELER
jgi:hypothetical protein